MHSVVGFEKEAGSPPGDDGLGRDSALGTRYSALLFSSVWLGLPADPDARELARRLAHLNTLDELTRRRIRKELRECLADMLGDDCDAAVA